MAVWTTVHRWLNELRERGPAGFCAAYPEPFLTLELPLGPAPDEAAARTEDVTASRLRLAADLSAEQLRLATATETLRVLRIRKQEENGFPDRITLGRGRENDVCLPQPSVSKLHAFFDHLDDGRLTLTDAGSRNGTMLNGVRLPREEAATLEPLDRMVFGDVQTAFRPADAFAALLARLTSPATDR